MDVLLAVGVHCPFSFGVDADGMWMMLTDVATESAVELVARLLTRPVRALYSLLLKSGVATVV